MEILNGKQVAADIKAGIKKQIEENYILQGKIVPKLACVVVGNNPASAVYVKNKEKACEAVGFESVVVHMPEDATESEVIEKIEELNSDESVSAILLQLPLPNGLNERKVIAHIDPEKDADGLTDENLGLLFSGKNTIAPCTAAGILDLLDAYNIDALGKHAVVIGRSLLVGKSVSILLQNRNATVTMCHSKTRDLAQVTRQADILVVAIGKPKFISADMVKDGAVVIDVGINRTENGLVGDVDYESVSLKASHITPVPGGVGPMTIAELLNNTLILHENNN